MSAKSANWCDERYNNLETSYNSDGAKKKCCDLNQIHVLLIFMIFVYFAWFLPYIYKEFAKYTVSFFWHYTRPLHKNAQPQFKSSKKNKKAALDELQSWDKMSMPMQVQFADQATIHIR